MKKTGKYIMNRISHTGCGKKKIIEKKVLPQYFNDIICNNKCFEIRKDSDGIQTGDQVLLAEWNGKEYTGRFILVTVCYVLRSVPEYGLKDGYCIFCW